MAHSLILGMTESGKTTFSKRLVKAYFSAGWSIIVLDPMSDPEWTPWTPESANPDKKRFYQTSDPNEFLRVFWKSKQCMVFIDEAGDAVGRYDLAMQQTATKGRHFGHSMHYLSQRGTQINRTVRDQCSRLVLFTTALEDAKIHAREWNNDELLEASQLPQGCYMTVTRFGELGRGSLFGLENAHVRTPDNSGRRGRDAVGTGKQKKGKKSSPSGTDPDA